MMPTIRTFVALDEGVNRATVEASLPYDATFQIVGVIEGLQESAVTLAETEADVILLACTGHSERALVFIDNAVKQQPDRPVIILLDGSPNGFVRRAFESGADDLVPVPATSEVIRFALEKALARKAGSAGTSAVGSGRMIVVLGTKGGTGKTVTSSNLTVALALEGKSSVLVDLDLQFGDVGLALGLAPTKTIYDLATSGGTLDADKVDSFIARHPSGARALLAPLRPDQAAAISTDFLREVFEILRSQFDFVIVDTPPAFSPEVITAVDASSHLCMVGMLDALSLKDTKIGLETLEEMGYDPRAITLVLNRADSSVGITQLDVEQLLGRAPDVLVGSDRAIPRALTNGQPITLAEPKSKAARSYAALAERYLAVPALPVTGANDNGRRRLLLRKAS